MISFLRKKGFSLTELLVVIAIVGTLSAIVIVNVNSARLKGRDARRMADLQQMKIALRLYKSVYGTYPTTGGIGNWRGTGTACSAFNGSGAYTTSGSSGYIPDLAPAYIAKLPVDPYPVATDGCYLYSSNGADYKLIAHNRVESVSTVPVTNDLYDPMCVVYSQMFGGVHARCRSYQVSSHSILPSGGCTSSDASNPSYPICW